MAEQILECVPNISEGKNLETISKIENIIKSQNNIKLLATDIGKDANRTVFTFIGPPLDIVNTAFLIIEATQKLINMENHLGVHPRIGAVDVCPLIPIKNISMEEVVKYAHNLGKMVADKLNISGYFYEFASLEKNKKNLADCRKGNYEGIEDKIRLKDWQTDFGPKTYNSTMKKFGLLQISARNILIAYNINLRTKDVSIAKEIASKIRQSGYKKLNKDGTHTNIKGIFESLKSIGWYIKDFDKVQVSCNLTDYKKTPIVEIYDMVKKISKEYDTEVTGSELIGLIPKEALLTSYSIKFSKDISENNKLLKISNYLKLDDISCFDIKTRLLYDVQ
ncbi:MAG: glutamate formimidoyltransferase [Flavobacteriaceae bacterium]|nr:glutamate formimidoyltransferase [Flavobacteriaceae bacterium]